MQSENKDIRWIQRFNNFTKALSQLEKFVKKGEDLNEMEEQGLIQAFEYTYELAWNTVKDFIEFQGKEPVYGSRDAITIGFKIGLIKNGEVWMKMFKDRNRTSHTYNQKIADEIAFAILHTYFDLFKVLHQTMSEINNGTNNIENNK